VTLVSSSHAGTCTSSGPPRPKAFAAWAGIAPRQGGAAFDALRRSMNPVRTSVGDAWILTRDEPTFRAVLGAAAPARLLPSGDAYLLGDDRQLLVADADLRRALWPPRVWPGGLLVEGELVGTWRRAQEAVTIQTCAVSRERHAMRSRRKWSPCRCPVSEGGSSSAGTDANSSWRREVHVTSRFHAPLLRKIGRAHWMRSFCIAHRAAAARVDTSILV